MDDHDAVFGGLAGICEGDLLSAEEHHAAIGGRGRGDVDQVLLHRFADESEHFTGADVQPRLAQRNAAEGFVD